MAQERLLKYVFFKKPLFDAETLAAARTAYLGVLGFTDLPLYINFTEGGSGITSLTIDVAVSHEVDFNLDPTAQTYYDLAPIAPIVVSTANENVLQPIPLLGNNARITITPDVTSASGLITVYAAGMVP